MIEIKQLIYKIKTPCSKCPYTLGLVYTVKTPCPECKEKGYRTFEQFQNHYPKEKLGADLLS